MSNHVKAIPEELKGFEGLLERNAGHFKSIESYAEDTASDTSGFTGVMALLIPVVSGVTALYGESLQFANSALLKVKEELGKTADGYEEREQKAMEALRKIEAQLDSMKV